MSTIIKKYGRGILLALLLCVAVVALWYMAMPRSPEDLSSQVDSCKKDSPTKMKCLTGIVDAQLAKGGLSAAFDALSDLYGADADFAAACHGNAHELGDAAYRLFASGEPLALSTKTSYCGYGFYHGFMERLIAVEGSADRGKEFCTRVGVELHLANADAEGACYHGIGHGAVDGTFPDTWGNPAAMIAPGLTLCERTLATTTLGREDFGPLYRCITGSYNALEILSQDPRYKLTQVENDPFSFCATQDVSFRPACYTNMLPALLRETKDSFTPIIARIDALVDVWGGHEMRKSIVVDLLHEYVRLHVADADGGIASGLALCSGVNPIYKDSCIQGIAGGFFKYGPPTKEYERAFAFCGDQRLSSAERASCFGYILPRLRNFYTLEKSRLVCAEAPEEIRAMYCNAYE